MAVDVTEFVDPPFRYGELIPAPPIAFTRNTNQATGAAITLQSTTRLVRLLPDADCRMRVTTDGTTPAAIDTTAAPLKANVQRDFSVSAGQTVKLLFG